MAETRDIDAAAKDSDRDFALWAMIIQTRDILFKARDNELGQYGITAVEARALFVVNLIGDSATPAMISKLLMREHNTVTALLTRMESKGLISRNKDPQKANSWKIGLTDKGHEAYQNSLVRQTIHDVFLVLNEEERELLIESLQKIRDRTLEYMTEILTTTY
ncbi:MAG TPA: winged helix DNA-binding protein [Dehalococcoidia bacterium]|nr:winged helix DNA-binding protein [Dehalococcoidia bacterium]